MATSKEGDSDSAGQDSPPQAPSMESDASPRSCCETSPIQTSDMIEGYHVIAEWIRFADAKAAVVLTVGGAVAGLVIPTLSTWLEKHPLGTSPALGWTVVGLFSVWLLLLGLSGTWAFLCILPFRRKGRHPALDDCRHFHPAAIATHFQLEDVGRFQSECEAMGDAGLRSEVAACLLIDSHISSVKYRYVTTSIRLMAASAIVGLAYLVAIQF